MSNFQPSFHNVTDTFKLVRLIWTPFTWWCEYTYNCVHTVIFSGILSGIMYPSRWINNNATQSPTRFFAQHWLKYLCESFQYCPSKVGLCENTAYDTTHRSHYAISLDYHKVNIVVYSMFTYLWQWVITLYCLSQILKCVK